MEDEALMSLRLLDLNSHAVSLRKTGDSAGALGTWQALFAKAAQSNLTHPEMHAVRGNAAAAALDLELWEEALSHARSSRQLAEASLRRWVDGGWAWPSKAQLARPLGLSLALSHSPTHPPAFQKRKGLCHVHQVVCPGEPCAGGAGHAA